MTNFKITNTLLSNVSVDKKGIVLRYLFTYEYETDKKHVFANYIKVYLDSDLKIIDISLGMTYENDSHLSEYPCRTYRIYKIASLIPPYSYQAHKCFQDCL